MKDFKNVIFTSANVKELKNNLAKINNNAEKQRIIDSIIEDTYIAVENIEEVMGSSMLLSNIMTCIQNGDTSFLKNILGMTSAGNNESFHRVFLTIDGKNAIEVRVPNHYETSCSDTNAVMKILNSLHDYLITTGEEYTISITN